MSFHTPQPPSPLNLDLAELAGGGACPAQFEGSTHDGRYVYVRYRGGALRMEIDRSSDPGEDDKPECVLDIAIGPPYDGSISRAQFCRLAGVTIKGCLPDETDPDAAANKDLSGKTTFWNSDNSTVTIQTARSILQQCHEAMPGALLVQPVFSADFKLEKLVLAEAQTANESFVLLVDGVADAADISTAPSLSLKAQRGQLQIMIRYSPWRYPRPLYGMAGENHVATQVGRPVFQAGHKSVPEDIAITTSTFSMQASFPTGDTASRAKLERLEVIMNAAFVPTPLEKIDLVSGARISEWSKTVDPALVAWCHAGPDRFIMVSKYHRDGPWFGVRPKSV